MQINELKKGIDRSKQLKMISKKGGYVDFSIMNGELSAHTWHCPSEGMLFLKEFERYANENNLKLVIPTVISPKLKHILLKNNYHIINIFCDFMEAEVELYVKK